MLDIKIYGTGTSGHEYLKLKLKSKLDEARIEYKMESIIDVNVFIEKKIHSIPAIQINNGAIWELNPQEDYHIKTRNLIQKVLNSKNYGQMKRILLATDFSKSADNAFHFASSIAKQLGAFIKIVHAYHPSGGTIDGSSYVMEKEIESRRAMLNTFVEVNNKDQIGVILNAPLLEQELKIGFAADIIAQESEHFDLLIVGARGSDKMGKRIFGSVSIQLAKYSKCPILIVPEEAKINSFKKILYTSANTQTDLIVFPKLISIAKEFNSTIDVLHISSTPDKMTFEHLNEIISNENYDGSKITTHTILGSNPEKEIKNYASENEVDLICFGKHNKGFWHDVFVKSTTKEMALISNIPMLIIHDD